MLRRADIEAARQRIRPHLKETPCVPSELLCEALGCWVVLKFENLQRTGSFKERGALSRLLLLDEAGRSHGVIRRLSDNGFRAEVEDD